MGNLNALFSSNNHERDSAILNLIETYTRTIGSNFRNSQEYYKRLLVNIRLNQEIYGLSSTNNTMERVYEDSYKYIYECGKVNPDNKST